MENINITGPKLTIRNMFSVPIEEVRSASTQDRHRFNLGVDSAFNTSLDIIFGGN